MALTLVEMELPIQQYLHEGHSVPTVLSPLSPGTVHEPCPGHMGRSHHIHASLLTPPGKDDSTYPLSPTPWCVYSSRVTKNGRDCPTGTHSSEASLCPVLSHGFQVQDFTSNLERVILLYKLLSAHLECQHRHRVGMHLIPYINSTAFPAPPTKCHRRNSSK